MNKNTVLNTLERLGLTDNEAKIYLANLSLGPTTILNIAKSAKMKRSTVYTVMESLKAKGLVSVELFGFKQKFVAEHPKKLKVMLKQKEEDLGKVMSDLTSLYNIQGDEGLIRQYEGLESVKTVYDRIIDETRPGDFLYIVSDSESFIRPDPDYFKKYIEKRGKLKADLRLILKESKESLYYKSIEKNISAKIKIVPKDSAKANFSVTPQMLLVQSVDPVMAIVIENKNIIDLQKELFLSLWRTLD